MTTPHEPLVRVERLEYRYAPELPLVLRGLSLTLDEGLRCLLIGANGAGKTTFLELLAGRHMIPKEVAHILGRPAFHDTTLAHDVAFIGGPFPFRGDVAVETILARTPQLDWARTRQLVDVLGVDTRWHMHRVSDGQRRRVQILLKLLKPSRLLLLDEITTDLDVVARADLLTFLRDETETRGTTILYATHIFDSLEEWATHLVFLDRGEIRLNTPLAAIDELQELHRAGASSPLHRLVERWLRAAQPALR
jgi:CCR4-NOT complex subunit CAF16